MAAYNEEVLIRQKPGGPFPPVRLHRYLDHPDHRNKTELLNRLGRSVVTVTFGTNDDRGGSGFLAKFRLAEKDEFYALVTNAHVITINFVCRNGQFDIYSELCRTTYHIDLSTCPFVFCSAKSSAQSLAKSSAQSSAKSSAKNFPRDVKLIKRKMSSNCVKLFYYKQTEPKLIDFTVITRTMSSGDMVTSSPESAQLEEGEPYLDATVIELDQELIAQIGKENFIPIDALQHNTRAVKGDKIFVLEYPSFKNAVPGTPRHLCISEGVVGNYLHGKWLHYMFKHMADTQFRASGSPVLRWDGTVCGVHRAGKKQKDERGNPDDYNVAFSMDVLLEHLQAERSQNP